VLIAQVHAAGQEVVRLSVADAQAYALQHNVNVINSGLEIDVARNDVRQLVRTGLPQVNGEIGYTHFPALPTSLIPAEFLGGTKGEFEPVQFGTEHNVRAGATLSQLLFDGSYLIGVKAARQYVDLRKKELVQNEVATRELVAKAYYSVLVADENVRLLERNHEVARKLHYETDQIFKAGFVEEIEVDRLALTLANIESQISSAKRFKSLSESLLKFQMGMDAVQPIALTDSLSTLTNSPGELMLADANPASRIEWELMDMHRSLRELNIKRLTSGYYPTLSLFMNYENSAQRGAFDFFEPDKPWYQMASWGVTMKIPIFDSFQKSAGIQKERTQLQIVMNQREQLRQGINLEVEQARTNYLNATEQVQTQTKNLSLAEKILNTARLKYAEGVGSSLELSSAQTTWLQTQTLYIQSLYELLIAKTDLQKALGIL